MLRVPGRLSYLQEFSPAHLADARYLGWLRDLDVVRGLYRMEYLLPLRPETVQEYVQGLWKSGRDCFFALHVAEDEAFVGTVKLGHIDWRAGVADVGIMIGDPAYRGRGLSVDAVRTVCRYGFEELGLRRLTGGTAANNAPMIKCFERVGFVREGTLRQHLQIGPERVDHALFGLLRGELTPA